LDQSRGPARTSLTRIDELLHDRAARRDVAGAVGLTRMAVWCMSRRPAFRTLASQAIED
jgi:hypothetical protein